MFVRAADQGGRHCANGQTFHYEEVASLLSTCLPGRGADNVRGWGGHLQVKQGSSSNVVLRDTWEIDFGHKSKSPP